MKDTFIFAFNSIAPIIIIVFIGYAFRRLCNRFDKQFYNQLNSLTFKCFMPVYLFVNVNSIGNIKELNWGVFFFIVGTVIFAMLIGMLAAKLFISDKAKKATVIQSAFRSNQGAIGFPLANALGGAPALSFSALCTGLMIPLYNILGALLIGYYNPERKKDSVKSLIMPVITNPFILGALAGFFTALLRQTVFTAADGTVIFSISQNLPFLYSALVTFSKIGSPMLLFCLGASLEFETVKVMLPQISLSVFLRLVLCPSIAISIGLLFKDQLGLTSTEIPTLISVHATPVPVAMVVMTQEIGGDVQFASQVTLWSTVLSMFTIFAFVSILKYLALI